MTGPDVPDADVDIGDAECDDPECPCHPGLYDDGPEPWAGGGETE